MTIHYKNCVTRQFGADLSLAHPMVTLRKISHAMLFFQQIAMAALPFVAVASVVIVPLYAVAQEIDVEKLARSERIELAGCLSDVLVIVEKHGLPRQLFRISNFLKAACSIEIERVTSAAERQIKDDIYKKMLPSQLVFGMFQNASELAERKPLFSCSGTGCRLEEYRTCLMRNVPVEIRNLKSPNDFEKQARHKCTDTESAARIALTNDFGNVQRRHLAGNFTHQMNDEISNVINDIRQEIVVLYAEDLVKAQPGRKSCKPEMCGASPCISLGEKPTEYQCAISQR
jgi:hypothetical protein